MTRVALMCGLVLLALGCKRGEEPAEVVEVTPEAETPTDTEPSELGVPDPAPAPAPAPEPAAAAEPAAAPEPAAGPKARFRDLADELRAAVGSPVDCIKDYRPSSATTLRVRIGGVVRPTGMIIEPSASGRGLSANDRRCIEERVGAVMLEPLSGPSSEAVSTFIDIPYEPPTVETYEVAAPPPQPDDVVPSLPKKKPIAPSGTPIEGPAADPIEGPSGVPIDGPQGVPIEGPKPVPIKSD